MEREEQSRALNAAALLSLCRQTTDNDGPFGNVGHGLTLFSEPWAGYGVPTLELQLEMHNPQPQHA
jgi:hypothetical protein